MSSFFPDCPPRFLLPDTKTLLVTGPFHPSAPIHFAYSSRSANLDARIVIISPSQPEFEKALKEFNDEWLASRFATGQFMDWASNVKIFYPPSAAHVSLLLSMFHTLKGDELPEEEWLVKNMQSLQPPTHIILCEPSSYFTTSSTEEVDPLTSPTIPAYLNLISRAISLVSSLGTPGAGTKLALFDSRLATLKLPVTHKPSPVFGYAEEEATQQPSHPVLPLVQQFFERVALFEQDPLDAFIPSSQGDEDEPSPLPRKKLKVYQPSQQVEEHLVHTWSEGTRIISAQMQSYFVWDIV